MNLPLCFLLMTRLSYIFLYFFIFSYIIILLYYMTMYFYYYFYSDYFISSLRLLYIISISYLYHIYIYIISISFLYHFYIISITYITYISFFLSYFMIVIGLVAQWKRIRLRIWGLQVRSLPSSSFY